MPLANVAHEGHPCFLEIPLSSTSHDDRARFGRHRTQDIVDGAVVQAAELRIFAPDYLKRDRSTQETNRRADPGIRRNDHLADTEFFRESGYVQRGRSTESDYGIFGKIPSAFDGVNASGIRHCLIYDFGDRARTDMCRPLKHLADGPLDPSLGGFCIQYYPACSECVGIDLAQRQVCVGDSRVASTPAVADRSRFR